MAPGGTLFRFPPHFGENVLPHGSHEWIPYSKDKVRLKTVNNNFSQQRASMGASCGGLTHRVQSLPTSNFSIPSSYHSFVMYSPPAGTVGPAAVRLPESRISPISSGRIFPSAA